MTKSDFIAVISTSVRGELKISGAKSLRTGRFLSRLRRDEMTRKKNLLLRRGTTKQSFPVSHLFCLFF